MDPQGYERQMARLARLRQERDNERVAAALLTLSARAMRQRRLAWALTAEPVDPEIDAARLVFRRAIVSEIEGRIVRATAHLPDQDVAMSAAARPQRTRSWASAPDLASA